MKCARGFYADEMWDGRDTFRGWFSDVIERWWKNIQGWYATVLSFDSFLFDGGKKIDAGCWLDFHKL